MPRRKKQKTGPLELSVETYLIREVAKRDGLCLKMSGENGIPDRLVLLPHGSYAMVECKRPKGGRVSKAQALWLQRLTAVDMPAYIITCREEVDEFMKRYDDHISGLSR